jgi:hypothetical protein
VFSRCLLFTGIIIFWHISFYPKTANMESTTAIITFLSTLGGGLITAAVTYITGHFQLKKDEKSWQRQQQADDLKYSREELKSEKEQNINKEKFEKESLQKLYESSIKNLSLLQYNSEDEKGAILPEEKKLQAIEDIHTQLSALLTRRPELSYNNSFYGSFDDFCSDPTSDVNAEDLKMELIRQLREDPLLFPNRSLAPVEAPTRKNEKKLQITVDEGYRKQQLIKGEELPQISAQFFTVSQLTASQRKKLADIYFDNHKTIPFDVKLFIPVYLPGKNIVYNNKTWSITVDPFANVEEIFEAWEKVYDEALLKAHAEMERALKQG